MLIQAVQLASRSTLEMQHVPLNLASSAVPPQGFSRARPTSKPHVADLPVVASVAHAWESGEVDHIVIAQPERTDAIQAEPPPPS